MKAVYLISFLFISGCLQANSMLVELTKKDVSCFGKKDGEVALVIKGGKAPYSIFLNGLETSSLITNLSAGSYCLIVKDSKGRKNETTVLIEAPRPLSINYEMKTETLVDNLSGTMNVHFSGGTPWITDNGNHYIVRLDGISNYPNPELIEDGIHQMEIEDASGCRLNVKVNLDVRVMSSSELNHNVPSSFEYNGFGNVVLTVFRPKYTVSKEIVSTGVQQ